MDDKSRNVELTVRLMKAGSRFAHSLYDEFGNLVLEGRTPITEALLKHLAAENIDTLYYDPALAGKGADSPDGVPEGSSGESNDAGLDVNKPVIDDELMNETVAHTKDLLESIRDIYTYSPGETIPKEKIKESRDMINKLLGRMEENSDGVFSAVAKLKDLDEYHYHHSTTVSVLGALLGARLEYKQELRAAMGLGGLFHDIGQSSVSKDILNKVEKLTDEEFDIVQGHPHVGYKLVENNPHMQELEKQIVLLHHEKGDGSGYPFGFDLDHIENRISKEVRLMSLCDVYTALVIRKPGSEPFTSKQALRIMLNLVYAPYKKTYHFLPTDFREFIRGLGFVVNRGNFFMARGDLVRLNSGEVGLVEEMNKLYPLNPKIRIVKDRQLQNVKRAIQVDMLKDYNSYIANVFDRSQKDPKSTKMSIQKADTDEA
ncbi:MAG: HD domain-containing protein [bacterium]|nr:HD domain-containing protein [bacterium]